MEWNACTMVPSTWMLGRLGAGQAIDYGIAILRANEKLPSVNERTRIIISHTVENIGRYLSHLETPLPHTRVAPWPEEPEPEDNAAVTSQAASSSSGAASSWQNPHAGESARQGRQTVLVAAGQVEEIALDKTAARIVRKPCAERQQTGFVPFDDRGQIFDDGQRSDRLETEDRVRRVSKPEPPDKHLHLPCATGLEKAHRNGGKRNFGRGEHVRHQMLVIQYDFDDIAVEFQDSPSTQDKFAKWRLTVVQFLEEPRHGFRHRAVPSARHRPSDPHR